MQDIRRAALLVPCQTKEHLSDWFKVYLDFHAFQDISSRFATATPMDAAWEAYNFAVHTKERTPKWYLFASARSTQKTITLAAVEVAIMIHAKRTTLHYAGSKDQVDSGYAYVKKFLMRPIIRDLLASDITASQTELLIPSKDNEQWLAGMTTKEIAKNNPDAVTPVKISVYSISPFQVQSKHESVVGVDEIHTLKGEKAAAYKDIRKIPIAAQDGKPWIRIGISSRKMPNSLVESEIENKDKTGLILRQWTVFEGVEQCPTSRNGGDFVHERYINVYSGDEKTTEEFDKYQGKDKDKYSYTKLGSGCLTCPLRNSCMGDLSKPKPDNKHYQSIEAAITDFISDTDRGWYVAQCLSLQPSREGIVFSRFDKNVFRLTPREMYKKFTGEDPGREMVKEELIEFMLSKGVKAYMGLDHGFTDPAAFVVNYEDSVGNIYVMHASGTPGLDPNQLVAHVKRLWEIYKFTHVYPDTAQPALNKLLKDLKLFVVKDDFDKKDGIADGISLIRGKISPINGGETQYVGLAGECDFLENEMERYQYDSDASGKFLDEPIDDQNHSCDAQRYAAINRWKRNKTLILDRSEVLKTETTPEYVKKIRDNQAQWLKNEISTAIKENTGQATTVGKNKKKTFFWDV